MRGDAYSCTWRSARGRRESDGERPAAAVLGFKAFRAALDGARSTEDANGSRRAYYLKRGSLLGDTCCVLRAVV